MKKVFIILTCLIMNITWAQDDTTTIYMIRHAQQAEGEDAGLSAEGKDRTEKWGDYFQDKNINAYYHTEYKRTIYTVSSIIGFTSTMEPGITKSYKIINYDPKDLLLKDVAEEHKGKNVLIVGHSNTIPKQINILLDSDKFNEINEDEYGNLFIIKIKSGKADIQTLQL